MTSDTTHTDGQAAQADDYEFRQTHPLALTDYDGADHRGRIKLSLDEDTLPSDAGEAVADDLNWAIEAVNAVIHHPNLVLWVRTSYEDLIIGHEPTAGCERAGHVRAATFRRSERAPGEVSIETETDAGLLTPFSAVNVLYDFLVAESYNRGYSMVLTDIQYLNISSVVDHPIIQNENAGWGRQQMRNGILPGPRDRDRTAYPERAYGNSAGRDQHAHAEDVLSEHVDAFAFD